MCLLDLCNKTNICGNIKSPDYYMRDFMVYVNGNTYILVWIVSCDNLSVQLKHFQPLLPISGVGGSIDVFYFC